MQKPLKLPMKAASEESDPVVEEARKRIRASGMNYCHTLYFHNLRPFVPPDNSLRHRAGQKCWYFSNPHKQRFAVFVDGFVANVT